MSRMVLAQHEARCPYGCCGGSNDLPKQSFTGTHRSNGKRAIKRAMKARDRQNGRKEIRQEIA